jgi:hypothetical protein
VRYCHGCGDRLEAPFILCDACSEKPPEDIERLESQWKQKADLVVDFPVWWDSPELYRWLNERKIQAVYLLREGVYVAEVNGVPVRFERQHDGTWLYSGVGWGRYTSTKLPVGVLEKSESSGQLTLF